MAQLQNRSLFSMLAICCSISTWALADEFRIDTMVFADESPDAICKTVTLVTDNLIYDHLTDDRDEVTIVDPARRMLILLDLSRQLRCELSFEEVAQFVREATSAAQSSPEFVRFAAQPRFDTHDDHNGTVLQLTGTSLNYRVETHRAPNDRVLQQLKDFMDWSARMNTLRPGLPPAARLELNQKLRQRKRIPTVVSCTIILGPTERKQLTSRHEYSWQLAPSDRAQLARYDRFIHEFRQVDPQTILFPAGSAMVDTE